MLRGEKKTELFHVMGHAAKLKGTYTVLCISVNFSIFCPVITTNVNALYWDFM